ncbi:hypothetical protein ACE6H2_026820 [Prunus campanulata]
MIGFLGFNRFIFATASQEAVSMLNGRMDWWSNIGSVVEDIRWLVVNMYVTDVLYQPRKGNGVAHALTQFGLKEGSSFVWTTPPWLDSLLGKDRDVGYDVFSVFFVEVLWYSFSLSRFSSLWGFFMAKVLTRPLFLPSYTFS